MEESEVEGGGDVCDLTEAEHFIEGQSRMVNIELMESDEINVDVSRGCTSSNVQILNENKVRERGDTEGGFNAAGIHKGKDSDVKWEHVFEKGKQLWQQSETDLQNQEEAADVTNNESVSCEPEIEVEKVCDVHPECGPETEDVVENEGSLQTELVVNIECDLDTEVQVETECVIQNEAQIGAESDVPTQRHVETECGVDTEERDKPESVHANTDESDSIDLLAGDESGSDAHDEELAAVRKLLREEAKMQKQRRSNKPFQESNNEKPTQPETEGIHLEEPAGNDNEANDFTVATKNVG